MINRVKMVEENQFRIKSNSVTSLGEKWRGRSVRAESESRIQIPSSQERFFIMPILSKWNCMDCSYCTHDGK